LPVNQPGSQFWGTGSDLTEVRDTMDPVKARALISVLGRRIFGPVYDYSELEFRGLYLPVTIIDRATGERFTVTPFEHLTSKDGHGN